MSEASDPGSVRRPRWLEWLTHPLPYLGVVAASAAWVASDKGWLSPTDTRDTLGYALLMEAPGLEQALSGLRPYGYPFLLKTIGIEDRGWGPVPAFHFALMVLAILFLWFAVRRFANSGWLAFALTAPLFFSPMRRFLPAIQPDSVAASFGLATLAGVLLFVRGRNRWAFAVFATWLLAYWNRPAYIFIAVLIPSAALISFWSLRVRARVLWPRLALLLLVSAAPLGLFSIVRWIAAGSFAPSALSGYTLGGVGSMFLDEELVRSLPDEHRALAREIFRLRKWRKFRPVTLESPPGYHDQYGWTLWKFADPSAEKLVFKDRGIASLEELEPWDLPGMMGPTALEMDRRLGALGKEVLRRRPRLYLKWITDGLEMGFSKTWKYWQVRWSLGLLAASAAASIFLRVFASARVQPPGQRRVALGIAGVCVLYWFGHLMISVLVVWPMDRYMDAAILPLPGAFAMLALALLWPWLSRDRSPAPAAQTRRPFAP